MKEDQRLAGNLKINTGGIMKADYWRQGVATILTAGILAVGAAAQDGAEGEVNIQDKAPAAATETEAPEAAPKPIKPQIVERDPFVNQLLTGNVGTSTSGTRGPRVRASSAGNASDGAAVASNAPEEEVEEVEIPAPEVTVNGIVQSSTGPQAIISTSVGTRMISPGQKLGDYRVSAIGAKSVTFTYGGEKHFKVEMDSEFGK
jgi:hypothetical protein